MSLEFQTSLTRSSHMPGRDAVVSITPGLTSFAPIITGLAQMASDSADSTCTDTDGVLPPPHTQPPVIDFTDVLKAAATSGTQAARKAAQAAGAKVETGEAPASP